AERAERDLEVASEQGRVERELRAAEERYRQLIESVRDYAICMLDTQGRVTSWNLGAERLMGYAREDIIGKNLSSFFPLGAAQACEQMLVEAGSAGRSERECELAHKGGRAKWMSLLVVALRDQDGKTTGYSMITRDLSEARRREAEQLELNERLRIS